MSGQLRNPPMNNLANIPANTTLPGSHPPFQRIGTGQQQAIIVTNLDEAWQLAQVIHRSHTAPKGMTTPESIMVAIIAGAGLKLNPFAALQSVAVINGKVTVYGDAVIGLVRSSGQMEWIKETITGEGDKMVATCTVKRRSDPEPISESFSMADAKRAKLTGKAGPWQEYPQRMLKMRARSFCLRDVFADVLGGLGIAEEVQDYPVDVRAQQPAPEGQSAPGSAGAEEPPPAPTEDEYEDPAVTTQRIIDNLDALRDEESIKNYMDDHDVWLMLEEGRFTRQQQELIEGAFRQAIEQAGTDEPPDPLG